MYIPQTIIMTSHELHVYRRLECAFTRLWSPQNNTLKGQYHREGNPPVACFPSRRASDVKSFLMLVVQGKKYGHTSAMIEPVVDKVTAGAATLYA